MRVSSRQEAVFLPLLKATRESTSLPVAAHEQALESKLNCRAVEEQLQLQHPSRYVGTPRLRKSSRSKQRHRPAEATNPQLPVPPGVGEVATPAPRIYPLPLLPGILSYSPSHCVFTLITRFDAQAVKNPGSSQSRRVGRLDLGVMDYASQGYYDVARDEGGGGR